MGKEKDKQHRRLCASGQSTQEQYSVSLVIRKKKLNPQRETIYKDIVTNKAVPNKCWWGHGEQTNSHSVSGNTKWRFFSREELDKLLLKVNKQNILGPRNATVSSLLKTRSNQSTIQHELGRTLESSPSTEMLLTVDGLREENMFLKGVTVPLR